jgi:hypothetical protein
MFKKLVFHLESPAGLIFPKVSNPDPLRCRNTGLFDAYRKHILQVEIYVTLLLLAFKEFLYDSYEIY